jgi:hypothetical protein
VAPDQPGSSQGAPHPVRRAPTIAATSQPPGNRDGRCQRNRRGTHQDRAGATRAPRARLGRAAPAGPVGPAQPPGTGRATRRRAGVPTVPIPSRGRAEDQPGPLAAAWAAHHQGPGRRYRFREPPRVRGQRRLSTHRLAGDRPHGQTDRSHLSDRTQPERRRPVGQRAGDGRKGGRRPSRRTRDGCGHDARSGLHRGGGPLRPGDLRHGGALGGGCQRPHRPGDADDRGDVRLEAGIGRVGLRRGVRHHRCPVPSSSAARRASPTWSSKRCSRR